MKAKLLFVVLLATSISLLTLREVIAKKVNCHGTSILHLMEQTTMADSDVESNAVGSITLKQNKQGHANNQRLTISADSLQNGTTYQLFASLRSDTNLTEVVAFTTDSHGHVKLKYVKKNNGHGNAGGTALPDALNPISDILSLAVVNSATQTVLSADLTAPDHLEYLIKRCLSNDAVEATAKASLRIHATLDFLQFRLLASGLMSNATYFLSVNDTIVSNALADAKGELEFDSLPSSAPDVLDIDSLALQNSSSNNVLSTTLP
jgi:hypothetical protein